MASLIANIGGTSDRNPELHKHSAAEIAELKAWEDHVRSGHTPYRKDCVVCVESRGRDRPHVSRQKAVDLFCLSLDISGPYEPGFDQHVDKPKYYITGVITIPTVGDNPLVEGLRALGLPPQLAVHQGPQNRPLINADLGHGETPPMAPNSGCGGSGSTAIAGQEQVEIDLDEGAQV